MRRFALRHRLLLLIASFCLQVPLLSAANHILIISSYSSSYQWTNQVCDQLHLKVSEHAPQTMISVEYLMSEFIHNPIYWSQRMQTILDRYASTPLSTIILLSDEAWMSYRKVDHRQFKQTPIVAVAIKRKTLSIDQYIDSKGLLNDSILEPSDSLLRCYNGVGIFREVNIEANIQLMKRVLPDLNEVLFVTDNQFYGNYLRYRVHQISYQNATLPTLSIAYSKELSSDSLISIAAGLPRDKAILFATWMSDVKGFSYSREFIGQQLVTHSHNPIFTTSDYGIATTNYFGGIFNDATFWGDQTFEYLKQILADVPVDQLQSITIKETDYHINWNWVNRLRLPLSQFPADTRFVHRPRPIQEVYRNELIFGIFLLLIVSLFIVGLTYTIVRLRRSTRLLEKMRSAEVEQNQQLSKALRKAKESDALKSAFVANMSHEIRTPLHAITGFSSLLPTTQDPQEQATYIRLIENNSDLLLTLVNDILDLAKLESGTVELLLAPVDLDPLMREIQQIFRLKAPAEIEVCYLASDRTLCTITDRHRLQQVISNFMTNALKFTTKGSIELGYRVEIDQLYLYVADTGIGIEPDKLPNIFDRFVKLNSQYPGSGLGLAISKAIIEMMNGTIGVESTYTQGSTFWARIPIQKNN